MDRTIKIVAGLFVVVLIGVALVFFGASPAKPATVEPAGSGDLTVYFFYGEECPHCHVVMPFIQNLSQKYPGVNFQILETWHNETNQALSAQLNNQLGVTSAGVPEVIVGKTVLIGDRDIPAKLESLIQDQLKKNP
jgi:thiol-disulfide isomerase/thioredoxin